jgi:hypothetical protein
VLVREPSNPYDPNAVRVEADGRPLGYVPKEDGPSLHAVLDKLAGQDRPATCRARLTGGWDRGHGDRDTIGLRILTGRRPSIWNGRVAFLPATPPHEHHQVHLLPDLPAAAWPKDKAVVTLVDAGSGALALRHGETWLGHIINRPDLVAYIGRVLAASLPPTARVRVQQGRLLVPLADQDAMIGRLSRLGTGDLPGIRRRLARPAGGPASGAGGCGTTPVTRVAAGMSWLTTTARTSARNASPTRLRTPSRVVAQQGHQGHQPTSARSAAEPTSSTPGEPGPPVTFGGRIDRMLRRPLTGRPPLTS